MMEQKSRKHIFFIAAIVGCGVLLLVFLLFYRSVRSAGRPIDRTATSGYVEDAWQSVAYDGCLPEQDANTRESEEHSANGQDSARPEDAAHEQVFTEGELVEDGFAEQDYFYGLWPEDFRPVQASVVVEESYFDDALFVGDSRIVGLMLYSGLTQATFYAEKAVNVNNLLANEIMMQTGGQRITILEALENKTFGKVYIKMGLNELGWRNLDMFVDAYGRIIDQMRKSQPEAVFYVMSTLPVSEKRATGDPHFNNERIMEFNELIKEMTWMKNVFYLDVFSSLIDDSGFLPDEAATDGVHLNKDYCLLWLDFLKNHTVTR